MIGPELQAKIDKLKNLIDAGVIDTETSGNGTSFLLASIGRTLTVYFERRGSQNILSIYISCSDTFCRRPRTFDARIRG